MNPDMDAIYLLSPQSHIVDCLMADFERRRYRKCFLVWTGLLEPQMRRRIDGSRQAQEQLAGFETMSIDFFPRESHLITFRDPWSFPILYHPACSSLVKDHIQLLARKVGIFRSMLGYRLIRFRLLEFAYPWENILKFDIIDLEILCMKQAFFAPIWRGLSRKSWMPTRSITRTFPHQPPGHKASSLLQIGRWI